jgi:hypothetical protein
MRETGRIRLHRILKTMSGTSVQLARRLGLHPQSTYSLLRQLEYEGKVMRTGPANCLVWKLRINQIPDGAALVSYRIERAGKQDLVLGLELPPEDNEKNERAFHFYVRTLRRALVALSVLDRLEEDGEPVDPELRAQLRAALGA